MFCFRYFMASARLMVSGENSSTALSIEFTPSSSPLLNSAINSSGKRFVVIPKPQKQRVAGMLYTTHPIGRCHS